jgi:hypothetical protein
MKHYSDWQEYRCSCGGQVASLHKDQPTRKY